MKEIITLANMTFQVMIAKVTDFPRPVSVNLQVTKHCNLDCPYCFADLETLREVQDISTKETFETIDELYKYGCRHIILMGGEPLIRTDIGEIIRYIKSKWMRCEIVTNGYFVECHVDDIKICDSVCISLDGPKEVYDRLRGNGCHNKVLSAMKLLKEKKIKTRIHAILTRYNLEVGL
ncbi:MAG: radical SAM protein, partial [Thermodesulfobacteriota bacterium]